jgi:predicted unusual protein kinase regulating ubiquinone biosynthesis (AarF/ABC1/UbiB family)
VTGRDGIRQGRLRRAAPVASLTARTAGEAVVAALRSKITGADTREAHARAAERYTELLGRSKGALMKAGQMLSFVSLGPAVPTEFQAAYQAALSRLRADAPPMPSELAQAVLEGELHQRIEDVFAEFDFEPLAAASIGQVHAAQLHDGRKVAVKIQYPGVAEAIRADLSNTELLATLLALLAGVSPRGVRIDVRAVAKEIEARVIEELDYRLEAASQSEFAKLYRGHPFIHVPDVIIELSTGRVLTQELVTGRPWSDALTAPPELRDKWAEAIHRFAWGSFHRFCLFNADPHPGNYLFHDDGSVSFLDFGCVKSYDRGLIEITNAIVRACLAGDALATWRAAVEGGIFQSSDPVSPEEVYDYLRRPFRMYWAEQPFTVTPEYMADWIERRYSPTGPSANVFRHISAAGEYAMLGRFELSIWSVVAGLRPTGCWASIAAEFFESAPPLTAIGQLEHAFFSERKAAMNHA